MKDIIRDVMASEEEAAKILQTAKDEATKLVAERRTAAQNASDEAKRAIRQEADKIVADAVTSATENATKAIEAARDRIEKNITVSESARKGAAEAVFSAVIGG